MWENVGVLLQRLDLVALCPLEIPQTGSCKGANTTDDVAYMFMLFALVYDF